MGKKKGKSVFWTDHERDMQDPAYRAAFTEAQAGDPYVEEANANPERRNNGCQIYRVGA